MADALRSFRNNARDLVKQKSALQRTNNELEQFAYVASHDLQEPLRMVASYCELIRQRYGDVLDERGLEFLEFATAGAKRMEALIRGLLLHARTGRDVSQHEDISLTSLLRDVLADLDKMITENAAKVEYDSLPMVHGSATEIRLIFQNLIQNAIKFRSDESPHVQISAAHKEGRVSVQITDNGIGIDSLYADRIFGIFKRLHSKTSYPGTGIGLAIVRKSIESHGGQINLQPSERGATFVFDLPRATVHEPEYAPALALDA